MEDDDDTKKPINMQETNEDMIPQQQHGQEDNQEYTSASILDNTWYYYQNPTTGTVSSNPLSVRQLCRLFCPVRQGMVPILPSHTPCLQVILQSQQSQHHDETNHQSTFGEWKVASEINVLKEAAGQWYTSVPGGSASTTSLTCRGLIDKIKADDEKNISNKGKEQEMLVYAKDITDKWTPLSQLNNLQLVLQALQNPTPPTATKSSSNNDKSQNQQQQQETGTDTIDSNGNGVDDSGEKNDRGNENAHSREVQDELEAFLSATAGTMNTQNDTRDNNNSNRQDDDDDDHAYESDGGTKYVKDPITGNWIHEALAPNFVVSSSSSKQNDDNNNNNINTISSATTPTATSAITKKKTHKKAKFSKRNAKNWIYVTGLPKFAIEIDTNGNTVEQEQEEAMIFNNVHTYFSKVGLLDLDPETLQPKIKLYREEKDTEEETSMGENNKDDNADNTSTNKLRRRRIIQYKGDASICYARSESVELALQILDDSLYDEKHTIKVERATFQAKKKQKLRKENEDGTSIKNDNDGNNKNKKRDCDNSSMGGGDHHHRRRVISQAQRKVARLALLQAQDEGDGGERLAGGRKGLRIVVIKNMITTSMLNDMSDEALESTIQKYCIQFGSIEKITCISKTLVVIVKYVEPTAAASAVQTWRGVKTSSSSSSSKTTSSSSSTSSTYTLLNPYTKEPFYAIYWDGVTDYTKHPNEDVDIDTARKEEEKRHEDFGKWLEDGQEEELPPELRLQVEGELNK